MANKKSKLAAVGVYLGFFSAAMIFSSILWFVLNKSQLKFNYFAFIATIFGLGIISLIMEKRKNEWSKTFFDRF